MVFQSRTITDDQITVAALQIYQIILQYLSNGTETKLKGNKTKLSSLSNQTHVMFSLN